MQLDFERTIVALASPLPPALRAIIRLSGPSTKDLLRAVLRHRQWPMQCINSSFAVGELSEVADQEQLELFFNSEQPRYCRAIVDLDWHGRWIDAGVYFWPTARSFTGQSSAELHLLGCAPLADRVINRFVELGASPAERGEFTLRSFLAGKIDLVQAEAVLGVIESVEGKQLHWALSQLGGNLSQPVRTLRNDLVNLLADLEAGLDFVEEDIEFITMSQLLSRLDAVRQQLIELSSQLDFRGTPIRPLELALVGLPNTGKSSLFNALLCQDRAIVSEQPGTTRDAVTARWNLGRGQQRLTLIDTAGIEQLDGSSPRALAQTVLRERIETCDVVMLCIDLSDPPTPEWIDSQIRQLGENGRGLICVGTKVDLVKHKGHTENTASRARIDHAVSVHHPDSISSLCQAIEAMIESRTNQRFTEATHQTAIRCRHAILHAVDCLDRARELIESEGGQELVANELHYALEDLGSIIGEVHNDDILGQIFSRFCIGK